MDHKTLLIVFSLTVTGCGIGEQYMNGLPPSKMKPYVPPRDYWDVEHFSIDRRESDWIECGGDIQGQVTRFNNIRDIKKYRELTQNLHIEVQRCMLEKGYRYIGDCGESNGHWPACGAP